MLGDVGGHSLVCLASFVGKVSVEAFEQHTDDFTALVADNGGRFLVPKQRNGDSSSVLRVCLEIQFLDPSHAVDGVTRGPGATGKIPTVCWILCVYLDQLHNALQAFQPVYDDGAMGPWAAIIDVEDITVLLGGEALRGDEVAKYGRHSAITGIWSNVARRRDDLRVGISKQAHTSELRATALRGSP